MIPNEFKIGCNNIKAYKDYHHVNREKDFTGQLDIVNLCKYIHRCKVELLETIRLN